MIYVTGDTHGEQARMLLLEKQTGLQVGDTLIVCGDFGYLFLNDRSENAFLDDLEKKPYTYCFVDGNHENFPAIFQYPQETWNGGSVHRVRRNVLHLMRGQVFVLEGKRIFTMGGAYSIDRATRKEGDSWWRQELPDNDEYHQAYRNLSRHGNTVDYILTHTMPRETILRYGRYPDVHDMELTGFLEWVMYEVKYTHWYCGHWHDDCDLPQHITLLWHDVRAL